MPKRSLEPYDLKVLGAAYSRITLYRGWFGWVGSLWATHSTHSIRNLVNDGMLQFVYDWGVDKPGVKITEEGRAAYIEAISAEQVVITKV